MIKKNKSLDIFYCPLGGAGQIGMNLYLYGYGDINNQINWIMIDCGIGFVDEHYPGIDIMVPNLDFFDNPRNKLIGVILTHAHEDHYGAIATLINGQFDVPVFCTKFTSELIKEKIYDDYGELDLDLQIIKDNAKFKIKEFNIELINVAHSIPEPNSIEISINNFNILHSGDWKIDDQPIINRKTDIKKLARFGKSGCDVLVCDSTNIFRKETSLSEKEVSVNLKNIIKDAKGLAIVTTFSSNVSRLKSIIEAAKSNKRKVILSGRSIKRFVKISKVCGYISKDDVFYEEKDLKKISKSKALIICTGSQGEKNASLTKIANGLNSLVNIDYGDLVVYSSKTIPGNENSVGFVKNKIIELGASIIDDIMEDVHTTGHPSRIEVEQLYDLLRPNVLIPMHGELYHLAEHIKFAKEHKINKPILVKNGEILKLNSNSPAIIEKSDVKFFLRDGDLFIEPGDNSLKERRRIQESGILFISLILDKNYILYTDPIIDTAGIPDMSDKNLNTNDIIESKIDEIIDSLPKSKKRDNFYLQKFIEKAVTSDLYSKWGKKTMCRVNITFV